MIKKLLSAAITFLVACILIENGANRLTSVWPVLLIVFVAIVVLAIWWRINRNRPRW